MSAALVFDRYEVVRRLAIGGMGEIFLARQRGVAGFDRLVILKSLLPDLARDDTAVQQFLDEARVAATLNHPNIISIYEVGSWRGTYLIAMEYIAGESIANLLTIVARGGSGIPYAIACKVIHDAAIALDHAHHAKDAVGKAVQIVHRDVSPQNVMIRSDGVTKVLDFGIAKAANTLARTGTGQVKGKLGYMSPEQVRGEPLDGRSDQFALGVMFWEMCSGLRLFQSESPVQTLHRLTHETIPRVSERRADVPPALDAVIARMLSRERDERFARCRDLATALRDQVELADEEQVATFVQQIAGADLAARTAELTPQQDDFMIDLRFGATAPDAIGVSPTKVDHQGDVTKVVTLVDTEKVAEPVVKVVPPKRTRWPLGLVALMIAIAAGGLWFARAKEEPTTESPTTELPKTELPKTEPPKTEPPKTELPKPELPKPELPKPEKPKPASHSPKPEKPPTETPPISTAQGTLTIATTPWAEVTIDDTLYGSTPLFKLKLPAGSHTLRLRNEGAGIDVRRTVSIDADKNTKLDLSLP